MKIQEKNKKIKNLIDKDKKWIKKSNRKKKKSKN